MVLAAKLEFRQRQALVVTPQLQQAIKLLQLSNLDLQTYIERELEQNPFLERGEEKDANAADADFSPTGAPSGEDASAAGQPLAERIDLTEALKGPAIFEEACDAVYSADDASAYDAPWPALFPASGERPFSAGDGPSALAARPTSLKEHLTAQLTLACADPAIRMVGLHLIDLVDDAGYLRADLDMVAAEIGASPQMMEAALAILQGFEPAGVCARHLKECLALQLKEKGRLDPMIAGVLDNLDLVAARDFGRLRKLCELSQDDLDDILAELRALNPKPGLKYGSDPVETVVPDVIVKRRTGGGWHVEINQETLPKLLINQSYYSTVRGAVKSDQDRNYVSTCLNTANWLIKSLDQRTRTILKVAEDIVAQQDAFLVHGVRYLKPLNLRDVADNIGMHESTVSRVTSNKYMATPRGLFEMKYFFTSAIQGAKYGEFHSSEAVRHRIRTMIDAEQPDSVLSDDQIVLTLRKEGIDIARRTVAKYREALRIPSSVQRRRLKRPALAKAS